jgi:hypothetical protein
MSFYQTVMGGGGDSVHHVDSTISISQSALLTLLKFPGIWQLIAEPTTNLIMKMLNKAWSVTQHGTEEQTWDVHWCRWSACGTTRKRPCRSTRRSWAAAFIHYVDSTDLRWREYEQVYDKIVHPESPEILKSRGTQKHKKFTESGADGQPAVRHGDVDVVLNCPVPIQEL